MCTQGGAYSNFHVFGFTATKTSPELHAVMVINGGIRAYMYECVIIYSIYEDGVVCVYL